MASDEQKLASPIEAPLEARVVSVLLRIAALRSYVQELRQADYPTLGSLALANLFIRITYLHEWVLQRLLEVPPEAVDRTYRPAYGLIQLELLRDIEIQTSMLSLATRFIESSKRAYATTELPGMLEGLVKTIGSEVAIIVRHQNEYGYQYDELVSKIIDNNEASLTPDPDGPPPPFTRESLLEGLPQRIGILTFPKLEANNVLLHSFGMTHELGHFVDEVLEFSGISPSRGEKSIPTARTQGASFLKHTRDLERVIAELAAQWKDATDSLQEETEIYSELFARIADRAWRWVTEFVADAVATLLAGPATVAGFLWLVQTGPEIEPSYWHGPEEDTSRDYPQPELRLRAMFSILATLGFDDDLMDSVTPRLAQWLNRAKPESGKQGNDHRKELRKGANLAEITESLEEGISGIVGLVVRDVVPEAFGLGEGDLFRTIRRRLEELVVSENTPWVYSPVDYRRETRLLCDQLHQKHLPCQIVSEDVVTPARLASILIAGWEEWIGRYEARNTNLAALFKEHDDLNAVLRTALEASQIHRRFLMERRRA